jgi:wyosine [tRNA(Phe)-imidazoG37] synthetase (radical SAM superfamily)
MQTKRINVFDPQRIFEKVRKRIDEVSSAGGSIDYVSFVPDGEPTLDLNLGRAIDLIRELGIKIAVITNSSLIWREDVREELARADWVSLKIDSVREDVWRRIDRPHGKLRLSRILDGALAFKASFTGRLVTETMLVAGINHDDALLEELAVFLTQLRPETAYLSLPIRPPAEEHVHAPDESGVTRAWSILTRQLENVECLTGHEGDDFFSAGCLEEDLLAITSVHPMRADAIEALLSRRGADQSVVQRLVDEGRMIEVEFGGQCFFVGRFSRHSCESPRR